MGKGSVSLTQNFVDRVRAADAPAMYYDRRFPFLALYVGRERRDGKPSSKSYKFHGRGLDRRQVKFKIADARAISNQAARDLAREAYSLLRRGQDPRAILGDRVRPITMGELFDKYLAEWSAVRNKASTHRANEARVERCLRPFFGATSVASVSRADIERFKNGMRDRPGDFNLARALLSKAFNLAISWGWREANPVIGVERYPTREGDRVLTENELRRLAAALDELEQEGASPSATLAVRLVMLQGFRQSEARNLRWSAVNFDRAEVTLSDSKTGRRVVPLASESIALLRRAHPDRINDWVCPGSRSKDAPANANALVRVMRNMAKRAGLPGKGIVDGVTLHAYRRTNATLAAEHGANPFALRDAFGWRSLAMPNRYVRRAATSAREVINGSARRQIETWRPESKRDGDA